MPDVKLPRNPTRRKHTRSLETGGPILLPPTPPVRSARAATIVRWFGLDAAIQQRAAAPADGMSRDSIELALAPGTITLVTGPSGAGKSSLLRDAQRPTGEDSTTWIDLATIALSDVPIVDCFAHASPPSAACLPAASTSDQPRASSSDGSADHDASLRACLLALARVGLGEAWTYLRTPAELSDGQRWRLRLALALEQARQIMTTTTTTATTTKTMTTTSTTTSTLTSTTPGASRVVLVVDEFAALLDPETACVIARSLRRAITPGAALSALVATTHEHVCAALAPDVLVRCDFGRIAIEPAPTIFHGPAVCGFADQRARTKERRSRSIGLDPRSRKRKDTTGGPVRKLIVTSIAIVALTTTALRADDKGRSSSAAPSPAPLVPPQANDRLLGVPPSPFDAPRSLFDFDPRPTRPSPMPLYPSVERELDRGSGRIESDLDLDLARTAREAAVARGELPPQTESQRFAAEHDRDLRIDEQQRRANRDVEHQQFVERESQALAAERERFYKSAGIDTAGAAHDTRELKDLDRAYHNDVKQFNRQRSEELKRLEKRDLKPDARAAARAEIEQRFNAAQLERRERYAIDRARVMGE